MSKYPKVLVLDIETAPIMGYVWGLWDNNLGLNQIKSDWHILSWSAKWLGEPAAKIMYMDQRREKDLENDKRILGGIWALLDAADVVVTHNGVKFDQKKLNARFILNGMQAPSSYRSIDTLVIAKKHFAFTSNKLEYIAGELCTKYKKYTDRKYPGFELWVECLARNQDAWREMEKYNKYDVLALEELYHKLIPWDNSINFNVYTDAAERVCKCGGNDFIKRGFFFSNINKFQRYKCRACGAETRDATGLLSKDKRESLGRQCK